MSVKIVADYISEDEFCITCKKCGTEHNFTKIGFRQFCLNNDALDSFTVNEFGILEPEFVCRNFRCGFSDKLWITNMKE